MMKKTLLTVMLTTGLLVQAEVHYAPFPYETDTVLTAWLIKHYKDPEALFAGIPKSKQSKIPSERQINTGVSPYRRSARFTAFETARRILGATGTCIEKLTPLSRVLEKAAWRKQQYPEFVSFELRLHNSLPDSPEPNDLRKAFEIIENYCGKKDGS